MTEVEYEYTYMVPGVGYPDDFAGLPSRDILYAKFIQDSHPGVGTLLKRVVAGRWEEVED